MIPSPRAVRDRLTPPLRRSASDTLRVASVLALAVAPSLAAVTSAAAQAIPSPENLANLEESGRLVTFTQAGDLVLDGFDEVIGFRTQHRAQTHGTFKFLFNALVGR